MVDFLGAAFLTAGFLAGAAFLAVAGFLAAAGLLAVFFLVSSLTPAALAIFDKLLLRLAAVPLLRTFFLTATSTAL